MRFSLREFKLGLRFIAVLGVLFDFSAFLADSYVPLKKVADALTYLSFLFLVDLTNISFLTGLTMPRRSRLFVFSFLSFVAFFLFVSAFLSFLSCTVYTPRFYALCSYLLSWFLLGAAARAAYLTL